MAEQSTSSTPLTDVAEEVAGTADEGRISVDDIMRSVGPRSFGPLILVLAIVTLSPLGSIPGASVAAGTLAILLGGQMLVGRPTLWLPAWIRRIRLDAGRVRAAMEKTRPVISRIDRIPRPRFRRLVAPPWRRAIAAACVLMGMLMFPLAVVPFGVAAPATALLFLGLALSSDDGLLSAIGLAAVAAALAASVYLLST
jgi:hypothetical protein